MVFLRLLGNVMAVVAAALCGYSIGKGSSVTSTLKASSGSSISSSNPWVGGSGRKLVVFSLFNNVFKMNHGALRNAQEIPLFVVLRSEWMGDPPRR